MTKKYTARWSNKNNKLYGWRFNGKIFRTKFMAERSAKKFLKDNPRKRIAPPITPLYKVE